MKINLGKTELIHFVGIGGIGMSGLALIMNSLGFKVQGSDILNNKNIERLEDKKILIEQQYNKYEIKHRLFDFDENLFEKLNNYDLAITRAGASTISELSQLCIPFIAIPFPFAKDNHQFYNAKFYENLNCCWIITQDNIDEESFSNKLIQLFNEEDDYFKKKENLEKISNQNTWNIVNKKLIDLINEN